MGEGLVLGAPRAYVYLVDEAGSWVMHRNIQVKEEAGVVLVWRDSACVRCVERGGVGVVGSPWGWRRRPGLHLGDEGPLPSIKRAMVWGIRGWLWLWAKSKTVPVCCLMAGKLLTGYYGLDVVSPQNSYAEALTSDVMIFGDGAFGDRFG